MSKIELPLLKGNHALRAGQYQEAIRLYVKVLQDSPELGKSIIANLAIAQQKYRFSRRGVNKPNVAVCGWELSHNAAGRVYTLATLYQHFSEVEIIGSIFPQWGHSIWEPIRTTSIPKNSFILDSDRFFEQALELVATHPYDIIHLSKPRAPNILFGVLYKLIWGSTVLMDIDDEELAFIDATTPVSLDTYLSQYGQLPSLNDLAGSSWTRLAVGLAKTFDEITVANSALQQVYGGEIIHHARDANILYPSHVQKEKSRKKFGISEESKVVLFFGTPREHKGLLKTARAIEGLDRKDVMFVIVGTFSDFSFKEKLQQVEGCSFMFIDTQPFSTLPEVVSVADVCLLLQDNDSYAAKYQTPAKLSDMLGMQVPVLVQATLGLQDAINANAVSVVNKNNVVEKLSELIDKNDVADQLKRVGSEYFLSELSSEKNAFTLRQLVDNVDNVQLNPILIRLFETFRSLQLSTLVSVNDFLSKPSLVPPSSIPQQEFINAVIRKSDNCDLYTFDIWDTVLRRTCDPDEIKLRAARTLWLLSESLDIEHNEASPVKLFWIRKEAENNIADEHYEYRIEDVLPEWLKLQGLVNNNELKKLAVKILKSELSAECSSTRPDATIHDLLKLAYGTKAILAISDFYHSSSSLLSILKHHNLDKYFESVYVSCDWMKTKRAGSLYDVVLSKEKIHPSKIIHIGDNSHADYNKAKEKGMCSFLYEDYQEKKRMDDLKNTFEDYLEGKLERHYRKILTSLGYLNHVGPQGDMSGVRNLPIAGKLLSPAIVGFVLFCMQEAIRRKCKYIFFFSREGIFFKSIYEKLMNLNVFDLDEYPKPKTLYVSRRATFAASLRELSLGEMMRMWNLYSTQSVAAMGRSLNLDIRKVSEIAQKYGIDSDVPIQYPWENEQFKTFFHSSEFQSYAKSSLAQQRSDLLQHLEKAKFNVESNENQIIVDIGWRGTIQDNISYLVKGKVHGVYIALKGFLNQQPENITKSGYLSNDNTGSYFDLGDVAALEFICNVPGGSVIGYEANGEPCREIFPNEENIINHQVAEIQKGIIKGTKCIGEYIRTHGLIAEDLIPLSRHIVQCYLKAPPTCIADAFLALEHNETFGTGDADQIGGGIDQDTLTQLSDAALHSELNQLRVDQRWSASFFNTSYCRKLFANFRPDQLLNIPCNEAQQNVFSIIRSESRKDNISIISPRPLAGSGGHRTIFNFAKGLDKEGFNVHIMLEGINDDLWYVEQELADSSITLHKEWYSGIQSQAVIATIAHSARYVREFFPNSIGAYFVQDYEAEFNPLSDSYVHGQNSYAQGLSPICIGHWLPHVLKKQFDIGAAYGGLGVDTSIYYPISGVAKKDMVAFLYQPEKWRRMPEICIEALSIVKRHRPQTEIVLYGSNAQPSLPFEATQRGLIHDLSELNKIYNEASVGLCLSLTNPSRIPIEYMAAGCVPVDLYRYNNLFDNPTGTSLLAYQSAESIAEAILHLLGNENECNARREKGIALARERTLDWEVDTAVNAVKWLSSNGSFDEISSPELIYHDDPIIALADSTCESVNFCEWQRTLAL